VRYWIVLPLLLLLACSKEVKIDIPQEEAKIVIDGRIELGGAPLVLLMQSQYLYSPTNLGAYFSSNISNANVTLVRGLDTFSLSPYLISELPLQSQITLAEQLNVELNELAFFPLKVYSSLDPNLVGAVGQTYTLNVQYDNQTYSATTKLLVPVGLDAFQWIPSEENDQFGLCRAFLTDPANAKNAYRWESKIITTVNGSPKDYRFRHGGGSYFDDQFFNGLSINFETRYPEKDTTYPDGLKRYFKYGDSVVIKLSHIEYPVYNYFDKLRTQLENSGSPFSSPVLIPSNFTNGALGIWSGYSSWYDTLVCLP
jgi:hypothetical protein